jgi:hypothetical protein
MRDVNLKNAIDKSRSILELGDDWDGKGSCGYAEETWKRATEFLWKMAEVFYDQEGGHTFFPPAINPGPDGSIDLHWKLQKFELLMNFPASPTQFPSCYGTDSYGVEIKRELNDPKDYVAMARWVRYA